MPALWTSYCSYSLQRGPLRPAEFWPGGSVDSVGGAVPSLLPAAATGLRQCGCGPRYCAADALCTRGGAVHARSQHLHIRGLRFGGDRCGIPFGDPGRHHRWPHPGQERRQAGEAQAKAALEAAKEQAHLSYRAALDSAKEVSRENHAQWQRDRCQEVWADYVKELDLLLPKVEANDQEARSEDLLKRTPWWSC